MNSPRVTLADIAKAAGVSRTAVSYALRDDANISEATRVKIKSVADALGYRPDPELARLMTHLHAGRRRGREARYAGKLAFINAHEDEPDFLREVSALADFFKSAQIHAKELGYETEEFWLHEPARSPKRLAQILQARGIRGLLVGSTGRHGSVVDLPWAKFAAVTVGYSIEKPALHRVVTHHYQNTRLALNMVTARGFRKVGLVVARESEAAMEDLHLAAFLAYQQGVPVGLRLPPLVKEKPSARDLSGWFADHRPDVILSTNIGVKELAAAGLRVPQDVAFVRLLLWQDDGVEAGVRPGYDRLGSVAINQLAGQLQRDELGIPEDAKIVQIEGRWSEGASLPKR